MTFFFGFVSGCVLLENLPPLCCVRAKDRSWRLHLGVKVETPCLGSRFCFSELGFDLVFCTFSDPVVLPSAIHVYGQ